VIGGVVLAAGASSRYGTHPPKQQVFAQQVVDALRRSLVDEVVVVTGAHPVEVEGARVVGCPEWERGPGASLRCGLAALGGAEAAVVVLADGPGLDPRSVDRVVETWREAGGTAVAASYGGVRLHPVLLARETWAAIPDEGARGVAARLVPCDDLSQPGDVDTREG
jgi:CTP:molybdopterin cytidylyltransferase MocA